MCYAYFVPPSRYDQLDDLLTRIHIARQRPQWRHRVLGADSRVSNVSTLRVLRAVEQCQEAGGASIRDVADFMAVE
ncbi:MarR family transcriptional regulator, partial [Mycobacterium sp. ITM-2017-0098]